MNFDLIVNFAVGAAVGFLLAQGILALVLTGLKQRQAKKLRSELDRELINIYQQSQERIEDIADEDVKAKLHLVE